MTPAHEAAIRMIQAGRWAEAEAACGRLLVANPADAQALQVLGVAKRHLGKLEEAESQLRRSVELAPRNAEFRTNLAQLLAARDKLGQSAQEFELALAIDRRFRPARLGASRLANRLRQYARAEEHARALIALDVRDAEAWSALGSALHGAGQTLEATAAFEQAVQLAPANGAARYQLAATLCEQERAEEALMQADAASQSGIEHRGLIMTRARALMLLDRYDAAEAALAPLIAASPQNVEAQFLLAQLRHVRGDADFARSLREAALSAPAPVAVRAAYADVMRRTGEAAGAERLLRSLVAECGPRPDLLSSLATILQECGRHAEALVVAQSAAVARPDDPTIAENYVAAALSAGEPREVLPTIERFRASAPGDQRWITYRADVARQCGESLFDEWCDLENLVRVYDLEPPRGYASIEAFHDELRPVLEARHRQASHPLDQSLRFGTQTSRGLLTATDAVIKSFLAALAEPLADFQREAGHAEAHPFRMRNTARAQLVGCWSVRLRRGGFHVNHIHPQGWISSAYYISVPAEVEDSSRRSGWIKFGEPRFAMPGCEAGRFVRPQPGRLVLFPSYLWHGTTPLCGDEARLAIAFDAVPQP